MAIVRRRGQNPAPRRVLHFVFGIFLIVGIAVALPLTICARRS